MSFGYLLLMPYVLEIEQCSEQKDKSLMYTATKLVTIFAIGDSESPILKFMSDGKELYTARYDNFEHVKELLKALRQEPIPASVDDLRKGYDIKGVTGKELSAAMNDSKLMNR